MDSAEGSPGTVPLAAGSDVSFESLDPADYDRAKKVLNHARHPGFVGRELFFRCATTGQCVIAIREGKDVGVALVAKGKLQALSVIKSAQGSGAGSLLLRHTAPRWVNAIGEKIPWFERRGYRSVGAPRVGHNGKHATQLMELAGDLPDVSVGGVSVGHSASPTRTQEHDPPPESPPPSFFDLRDDSPKEQNDAQLVILDALLAKAVAAERFDSALKIVDAARLALHRRSRGV